MLEIFKLKHSWEWAVSGKHPVARDYFSTCDQIPILKAFSNWVEKGYQSLKPDQHQVTWNAFRFWIKGPKKDLILGVLRDSSDSIGRIFPLLIIGTGALKNWEKNWECIPHICDKAWGSMEYFACKRYSDLQMLESDIKAITSPKADWTEASNANKNTNRSSASASVPDLDNKLRHLSQHGKTLFEIETKSYPDTQTLIYDMHLLLKGKMMKTVPNAIFTTTVGTKANIIVFSRPLSTEDFAYLHEAAK